MEEKISEKLDRLAGVLRYLEKRHDAAILDKIAALLRCMEVESTDDLERTISELESAFQGKKKED